jgi:hypothetical protein
MFTPGPYLVTPDMADADALAAAVAAVLPARPALVQYRNKLADARQRREQAERLLALCRGAGVPLVINDDLPLALAIGADGTVHRVVPLCEEALCPAAEAYAELVGRWRFQPGDLNGEPMPSRLRLEFEIGLPADEQGEDQAPRQ